MWNMKTNTTFILETHVMIHYLDHFIILIKIIFYNLLIAYSNLGYISDENNSH